ncbi:arenicin-1-like isoform X2 [Ptychodera flava]|uniref:arenicin-1-like isoform X2 n=1 Tax=Ptychodera flava TaxID=63121 RepID=UPI00396A1BF6
MKTVVVFVACLLVGAVKSAPGPADKEESKTYTVVVKDHGVEQEEKIVIDEERNVEIFQTVGSDDAEIVEDFDAGLEATVPKNGDSCYVKPMDEAENMPPAELKSDLESLKSEDKVSESENEGESYYTLSGRPIKNKSVVGETIANKCEGRDIYWLASIPHGDQDRDKRGCYWVRYCRYTYLGGGYWYRRCWYIVRCF